MKYISLLLLALFTSTLFGQQETVITGKLLGYDKKPMSMAHVYLIQAPKPQPIESTIPWRVRASADFY